MLFLRIPIKLIVKRLTVNEPFIRIKGPGERTTFKAFATPISGKAFWGWCGFAEIKIEMNFGIRKMKFGLHFLGYRIYIKMLNRSEKKYMINLRG